MESATQSFHSADILSRLGAHRTEAFDALDFAALLAPDKSGEAGFDFTFRDIPFQGLVRRDDGGGRLTLTARIGHIPFSAQAPLERRQVLQIIASANNATPLSWKTTPQQELVLTGECPLETPLTPAEIVAGITFLILQSKDYIDLILEVLGNCNAPRG